MVRKPSRQTMDVIVLFLETPTEWLYGYDLSRRLGIPSGTLYPILIRLSDRGHLERKWVDSEIEGRPRRHMYRITEGGAVWARSMRPNNVVDLRPALGES